MQPIFKRYCKTKNETRIMSNYKIASLVININHLKDSLFIKIFAYTSYAIFVSELRNYKLRYDKKINYKSV